MERLSLRVAVYVLLVKENKVFLMRRLNTGWRDGDYGLPSGHLEKGETLKAGATREVKEETGIDIKEENLEFFHVMHRNTYVDFFFTVKEYQGEPTIIELDKCDDAKWFEIDNLPENIIPSTKYIIQSYQNKEVFSEFFLED